MKISLIVFSWFWAGAAFAHPGHLIEAAGHDHWLAGAAIGAAIAAGIWGALKGKAETENTNSEQVPDEQQEA